MAMHMCAVLLALCFAVSTPLVSHAAVFPAQQHSGQTADGAAYVLQPEDYHHYAREFMAQQVLATRTKPDDPWPWMLANIPWFDSSDKQFEELYYFRWYAWRKHVTKTPHGYVITEFLPPVKWAGPYNTVPDALGHHLYEARWLRNPKIAEDDARFWLSPGSELRKYSSWIANATLAVAEANGNRAFAVRLLPEMVSNYNAWVATHQDPNGLFWQIDTLDGMEKSISGSGYRPTLNSYLYGDAHAIAAIAAMAHQSDLEHSFDKKAETLRDHIETYLWNPKDQFYEVRTRAPHSHLTNVRELLGYIPWYFNEPPADHAIAWSQLFNPEGFAGKYGPTTAERRSPRFRFPNPDQCQWNGPSWPYATTQVLVAMANLEDSGQRTYVNAEDYYRLFSEYVLSQHLRLPNGTVIPWIDENLDADTGEWIARTLLAERKSPSAGRGAYYNHSGFADPLITGLIGLRPRSDDEVVLRPLLPAKRWSYFALDGLPYHGHILSIVYDQTGTHYHRGRGFAIFVDGVRRASRKDLGPLEVKRLGSRDDDGGS